MAQRNEVDVWFGRYESPMKPVVMRIRAIVLGADPRVDECIKWQAPTFTYRGNLASFFPKTQQHASLMFHMGAHIPGDHPRLEGTGDSGRVMKIASVAEADTAQREIERVVRAWCDWRDAQVAATAKKGRKKAGVAAANAPAAKSARGAKRGIGGGKIGAKRH